MIDLVLVMGTVARVLLDNCSSLYDCWDNVGPAAAAAVGAGAAAVLAGGLLLNPERGADATVEAPTTPSTETDGAVPQPAPAAPSVAAAPTMPAAPTGPAVSPGVPESIEPPPPAIPPVAGVAEGVGTTPAMPVSAAAEPSPAAMEALSDVATTPTAAPPVPQEPTPEPLRDAVVAAPAAVAGAVGASARGSSAEGGEGDEPEDVEPCPEADASLFGLPDNNTRSDCIGGRAGLTEECLGIDFTSLDERGQERNLPFEACVSGTVTAAGDGPYNLIEVTTANGTRIQYLHASRVYVRVGERVGSTTRLGVTGGAGPEGAKQYETHLHIQALDKDGRLIDPDCALAGKEDRRLRRQRRTPEGPQEMPVGEGMEGLQPKPGSIELDVHEGQRVEETPAPADAAREPASPEATETQAEHPAPSLPPEERLQAPGPAQRDSSDAVRPTEMPPQPPAPAPAAQGHAPSAPPAPPTRPIPPPQPMPVSCTNCGMVNPPGAAFCGRCGYSLSGHGAGRPPARPANVCSNCGMVNPVGAAFCGRCGARLTIS